MSRSPFFYVGDKYKLTNQFRTIFPKKINRLFEPFCGGGSVFLNIFAKKYVANDKNFYMIKLHNFLRSYAKKENEFFFELESLIDKYKLSASVLGKGVSMELKKKHPKTYYAVFNKEAYNKLKSDFNSDKSDLMKLYLLLIYGFNHMLRFNNSGEFNLPVGDVDYNKNVKQSIHEYYNYMKKSNISFRCEDFEQFLSNFHFKRNDFIYCDPPYLIGNSEYNKNWDVKEEKRLLKLLDSINKKGVKFALSNALTHKNFSNDYLIKWSKKYNVFYIKANYISYHDNTIKDTKEVLITNFKEAQNV